MLRWSRLAILTWLEVEASAAILLLPLANADLAAEIAWRGGWPHAAIVPAAASAVAVSVPLAIWGRRFAQGFRGWR